MNYSMNIKGEFAMARRGSINASYKDLAMVCNAIRYMRVSRAMPTLDQIISMRMPVFYPKYNKRLGARHELHGRKGKYPMKAAKEVKLAIQNAIASAYNKGMLDPEELFIVHASANKTMTMKRHPSKGALFWGRGMYGRGTIVSSDLELAKVEIALGYGNEETLSKNMKYFIKRKDTKPRFPAKATAKPAAKKPAAKLVDATKPEELKKAAAAIKEKVEAKKEEQHVHTHEGHDHAHDHSEEQKGSAKGAAGPESRKEGHK